jgi:hypothetical protein
VAVTAVLRANWQIVETRVVREVLAIQERAVVADPAGSVLALNKALRVVGAVVVVAL